ncbi:MAG: ribosomal protein S18-alanine N-acetyltransferase [Acidobacteriota bacterium]
MTSPADRSGDRIREADRRDLDALAAIERQSFDRPWSRSSLAARIDGPGSLVLVDDVGGYALLQIAGDEAELLRLAVIPGARGRGSGKRLLADALRRLSRVDVRTCHLEVGSSNIAALALYRRLGFRETGRRKGYYPDDGDALLMTSELWGPDSGDLP